MPPSWNVPADPEDLGDALHWFRQRIPLTDEELESLGSSIRSKAFAVAGASQMDLVMDVLSSLDDALADGLSLDEFKDAVAEKLYDAWGHADGYRVENIFRTNLQAAYGDGRYEVLSDPAVKRFRPYRRFVAVEDSRTSEICQSLDGTLLPADDPFWDTHWTPLHYQCRSEIESVGEDEAKELGGPDPEAPKVAALEGFGRPQQTWEPDLGSYPPEIARVYEARAAARGR